ncbi:MAG: hypothetical protein LWW85_01605 [Marinilabiliales bacterium]|nr:hypothetical protein [Marinilabiliales bacterium]
MKKKFDPIDPFDHLPELEVSDSWDESLKKKLNTDPRKGIHVPGLQLAAIALLLLFTANLVTFSILLKRDKADQEMRLKKTIQSEYLVFTESSKF